ncbi:nuclear transport factor 2 family protein [Sphingobium sp. ZW T5_29]|uniref:nuclear transport factor 2 family protein n=1 Tax=Sphingobium sp. ZW T5_29 TaxID=3378077 RepID=UPI003854BEA4
MTLPASVQEVLNAAFALDEAVDGKDWSRVRRSFMPLVGVRIGVLVGDNAVTLSADELVTGIAALNPPAKMSCHMLLNPIVTVTDDRAMLRAKRHGWARCDKLTPPLHELWGLVSYRFTCVDGEWFIDDMGLVTLREAGNQEVARLRVDGQI